MDRLTSMSGDPMRNTKLRQNATPDLESLCNLWAHYKYGLRELVSGHLKPEA